MEIKDFLAPTCATLDIRATDKKSLLRALAARAALAVNIPADVIAAALEKRDELGSTGFGGGVAIPHARMREIAQPFGVLARLGKPIDFDAIDGLPVDIVFMLLLPATETPNQPNALPAVARRMREPEVLKQMRQAANKADLYRAIAK